MPGLRIEYAPRVREDFDRIFDHVSEHDPTAAAHRIETIIGAIEILASHPDIGRPAAGGSRELVIGRGGAGYVARYRYIDILDFILVEAVRSQAEAGYKHA